jgi:tRNA A37 N6-isopentenylltransferase MiaA
VGGTSYYLLSLLFEELIATETPLAPELQQWLQEASLAEKRAKLNELDEESYLRIDHRDERKTTRAVEVALSGVTQTQRRELQNHSELRYDCRVIRVEGKATTVIEARVEEMVRRGLVTEAIEAFEKRDTMASGLWQAIGLKEFEGLVKKEKSVDLCVELVKKHSVQYAAKQERMLRNSVCPRLDHVAVREPKEMTEKLVLWIEKNVLVAPLELTKKKAAERKVVERWECKECGKVIFGAKQIVAHQKSDGHKKRLKKLKTGQ